jgi:hypothetical protein
LLKKLRFHTSSLSPLPYSLLRSFVIRSRIHWVLSTATTRISIQNQPNPFSSPSEACSRTVRLGLSHRFPRFPNVAPQRPRVTSGRGPLFHQQRLLHHHSKTALDSKAIDNGPRIVWASLAFSPTSTNSEGCITRFLSTRKLGESRWYWTGIIY